MKYPSLIINADDYGYNSNINKAIEYCFKENLINSTTMLVNFSGFDEAILLAEINSYSEKIGLHINLTEGNSLTDLTKSGLVNQKGEFNKSAISNPFIANSSNTKKAIEIEIREQYNKLIQSGISPTHLDSHQHIHTLPWIAPLVIKLAKEKKKNLRIAKIVKRKNILIPFYLHLLNKYLSFLKINNSNKFGNIDYLSSLLQKEKNINSIIEIMIHPTLKDGIVFDFLENIDLKVKICNLFEKYQLVLIKNPFDLI